MEIVKETRCFGGWLKHVRHFSESTQCDMQLAIYLPPQAESGPVPAVYWLSGLTCTENNFMEKAGAQRVAAELGLALVAPDTSPRGDSVPDADDGAYDLGLGAGFYVNATQAPWDQHYRMYDYIHEELPTLLEANFPLTSMRSICGHSMGGHGALVIAARQPERYQSVSAFAPICHPSVCPWGEKAFNQYLGGNRETWKQYDACELLKSVQKMPPILVDQGDADPFLAEQLRPQDLKDAAEQAGHSLTLRMHADYDHSYYFIASFIEQHLHLHAKHLKQA
jgi:S-formylglutathione hydrolase